MGSQGTLDYGHKLFSLSGGEMELTTTTITEKAFPAEDEESFLKRLLHKYGKSEGTVEIVFKKGRPDYAVICIT